MNWFVALEQPVQLALIGAAAIIFGGIVSALIAVIGFRITLKTSTAANRDVIRATSELQREAIAISAASKQAEFRQQWIENLRDSIATYLSEVVTLVEKESGGVKPDRYQEVLYQTEYIELMLNMSEVPSQELVRDLRDLFDKSVRPRDQIDSSAMYAARKKASESARKILKAEWDKLRTELKTRN